MIQANKRDKELMRLINRTVEQEDGVKKYDIVQADKESGIIIKVNNRLVSMIDADKKVTELDKDQELAGEYIFRIVPHGKYHIGSIIS